MLRQLVMCALLGGGAKDSRLLVRLCMCAFLIAAGVWVSIGSYHYFLCDNNKSFVALISSSICFVLAGVVKAFETKFAGEHIGSQILYKVVEEGYPMVKSAIDQVKGLSTNTKVITSLSAAALAIGLFYGYETLKSRKKTK